MDFDARDKGPIGPKPRGKVHGATSRRVHLQLGHQLPPSDSDVSLQLSILPFRLFFVMADVEQTSDNVASAPYEAIYAATPRKKDTCDMIEMKDMHFKELRPLLMNTLPKSIPEVELSWFLSHCVPSVSADVLADTMVGLQSVIGDDGRWIWYKEDPPRMTGTEDAVYKHIEDISNAVLKAGSEVMGRGTKVAAKVYCRPRFTEKSESQNAGYKSDANQMLMKTTGKGKKKAGEWYGVDVVTNFEFKKDCTVEAVNSVCTCSVRVQGTVLTAICTERGANA